MTVGELLTVLKLTNINVFKVNDKVVPFSLLKTKYINDECVSIEVIASIDKLTQEHLHYDLQSDFASSEGLKIIFPTGTHYIKLEYNFIINDF